jgi:hypothetical protein
MIPMSNALTTVSSPLASNKKKGPKPVRSLAEVQSNLMGDAVAHEVRKIDRKIEVEKRKLDRALESASNAEDAIRALNALRAEFTATTGVRISHA